MHFSFVLLGDIHYLQVVNTQLLMTIKQLIGIPALILNNIDYSYSLVKIYTSIKAKRAKCTVCEKHSNKIHDYYTRTISDLLVFQNKTTVFLKTRKFKYQNPQCDRKVFSEQTPYLVFEKNKKGTKDIGFLDN